MASIFFSYSHQRESQYTCTNASQDRKESARGRLYQRVPLVHLYMGQGGAVRRTRGTNDASLPFQALPGPSVITDGPWYPCTHRCPERYLGFSPYEIPMYENAAQIHN